MATALTPEEWAELQGPGDGSDDAYDGMTGSVLLEDGEAFVFHEGCYAVYFIAHRHSAAALCLHGQDFGFTEADADNHRMMAEEQRRIVSYGPDDQRPYAKLRLAWHESMADRIEALLPPATEPSTARSTLRG